MRLGHSFFFNYCHLYGAAELGECLRKYVDGISQNLRSLNSYYLIRSSHGVFVLTYFVLRSINISESVDISQSISINQSYPIKASNFIWDIFCFPITHHNSILSTHARRVCHSNQSKALNLCCPILNLSIVNLTT